MQRPAVKVVGPDQSAPVVDALVLAFVRDPVARFAFPEPTQHRAGFGALVLAMGGAALAHGSAFATEGCGGVALWLPPGAAPDEAASLAACERWVPSERLATVLAFMEQMGRSHPDEPHWYLPFIGVDPAVQNRGLGAALLRHALAALDRERRLAYLESTNPANVSLYERHGFERLGTIQVGDAPPIVPMVRAPRASE